MNTDLYRFFHSFHTLSSVKLAIKEHLLTFSKNEDKVAFIASCIQYHQLHNFKTDTEVVLAKTSLSKNEDEIKSIEDYLPILDYLQDKKNSILKDEIERFAVSFTFNEIYIDVLHKFYHLLKEERIGLICPKTRMVDFYKIFLNVPKEIIHNPIIWLGSQSDLIRVFDKLIQKGVIHQPKNFAKALYICFFDHRGTKFSYSFKKAIEKNKDRLTSKNQKKIEEVFDLF